MTHANHLITEANNRAALFKAMLNYANITQKDVSSHFGKKSQQAISSAIRNELLFTGANIKIIRTLMTDFPELETLIDAFYSNAEFSRLKQLALQTQDAQPTELSRLKQLALQTQDAQATASSPDNFVIVEKYRLSGDLLGNISTTGTFSSRF